jgi:hypothetical protein
MFDGWNWAINGQTKFRNLHITSLYHPTTVTLGKKFKVAKCYESCGVGCEFPSISWTYLSSVSVFFLSGIDAEYGMSFITQKFDG